MLFVWRSAIIVAATAALLVGCATPPQRPIDLNPNYFSSEKAKVGKVGVVMADLPKPDTSFPGAGCLLCIAVANGAHSALNREVQTFSTAELKPLPSDMVALLQKQGLDAILIDEPLKIEDLPDFGASNPQNMSRKNFASLKAKYNLDRLLVLRFTELGVSRSYASYVPTDIPKAIVVGNASMIELGSHSLEWYLPVSISRAAEGNWDEPPKFPGLANAYYQVLETGMDVMKKPLVR